MDPQPSQQPTTVPILESHEVPNVVTVPLEGEVKQTQQQQQQHEEETHFVFDTSVVMDKLNKGVNEMMASFHANWDPSAILDGPNNTWNLKDDETPAPQQQGSSTTSLRSAASERRRQQAKSKLAASKKKQQQLQAAAAARKTAEATADEKELAVLMKKVRRDADTMDFEKEPSEEEEPVEQERQPRRSAYHSYDRRQSAPRTTPATEPLSGQPFDSVLQRATKMTSDMERLRIELEQMRAENAVLMDKLLMASNAAAVALAQTDP